MQLLEREIELRQLDRAVEDALESRGRLVLVEGPPGIGKTRLLEAARSRARERGMVVLSARASELERDFPFGVVRQLFEPLVADSAGSASLLQGAAAMAAPLLTSPSASADAGAGGDRSLAHFHALYWLTANLAEQAPLMLSVDDVHWADATSLRFLQFLLPRLEELPAVVILGARPAAEPDSAREPIDVLATDPLALTLRPPPLGEAAVSRLVEDELGEGVDPDFSDACRDATGGNPFLLRELLRELSTERVEPSAARAPLVRQLAPPTVARAVLLRLARLGEDASKLARAVAVLGDAAPLRRACLLAEIGEERADEVAAALAKAGILAGSRPLDFAHPILRSAVYADIDAGERARAHRRAATLLADEGAAADEIAVHLLPTEPAADPYVAATLRDAAARARARGAAPVAVSCLRRALAEPPRPDERGALLLELASAELHAGDPGAALEHLEEGLDIAGDPRTRAQWSREQTVALQALGRYDEAYAVRERAIDEVAAVDRELALLTETSLIASAGMDLTRLAWARERLQRYRGERAAGTSAEQRLLAIQLYHDAMYGETPAAELADAAERLVASGKLVDQSGGLVTTPFFAAVEVLWLADRGDPARQALDHAVEEGSRSGSALTFACASGWRCRLLAREGALAEAEADARAAAELALAQGWFGLAPPMLGYILDVLVERGELDDAERLLERTGTSSRPALHDLTLYPLVHARARLRAARGDVDGGRADIAEVSRRRARWNTDATLVPALLAAPELASEQPVEARAAAARMVGEARAWGTPRAIGMALHFSGLVEGGERGLELLGEAAAALAESPGRVEHAHALCDLGAALRRANQRSAAREPLRLALDLADACGARPLAERARQELRTAGGRPRRPRISGAEALTASERRIAVMAAAGLSNPQIAQALFVTKKTVEAHLGSAYRKLGIHSRAQLGAVLDD